jgi:hypothetical protein
MILAGSRLAAADRSQPEVPKSGVTPGIIDAGLPAHGRDAPVTGPMRWFVIRLP